MSAFRLLNLLALGAALWLVCLRLDAGPGRLAVAAALAGGAGAGVVLLRAGVSANRRAFAIWAALFVLGEVAARALHAPLDDSAVFRAPRPYVEFSGRPGARVADANPIAQGLPGAGSQLELNALGLRGPLPSRPKDHEFRILMLGGSTVLLGTPQARSLPGQLEAAFRAAGRADVRVYNWGVLSYVSGQELALLAHVAPDYDPDLVVVYDGGNDVYQPYVYDPRPGHPYDWHLHEAGLRLARGSASVEDVLCSLLLRSRLLRRAFEAQLASRLTRLEPLRREVGYGSPAWAGQIASKYLENTRRMCAVARGSGFRLAVVLQPVLALKEPRTRREAALTGGDTLVAHMRSTYALLRREWPAETQDAACRFFDLSQTFASDGGERFWDLIHVYDEVNAGLAQAIRDRIEGAGLLPPPTGPEP